MATYNQEEVRKKIKEILDTPYEKMYPFEIEQQLAPIFKMAEENNDEQIKQEMLWEIDLINRAFGHKGTYQGNLVEEISNKWQYYLDAVSSNFTKPFLNIPFCAWKKEALEYYIRRLENCNNELAKARYAFAIMIFETGKERMSYAQKSFESWLKTAEKYVEDKKYSEFYEVPPFAYDFSLKLALSLKLNEQAKTVFLSLHKSIFKILSDGDTRWNFEFFEVESKYITQIERIDKQLFDGAVKESSDKLKELISHLKTNKTYHFMRSYIMCLQKYVRESEQIYLLMKEYADSHVLEAESRKEEPLVQSSFFNDAVKEYKLMQSKFPDKKEIGKKIEDISLKLKDINNKIKYGTFNTTITITKKQIQEHIDYLKKQDGEVFNSWLCDKSIIPNVVEIKNQVIAQKKSTPLQFIVPVTIYSKDSAIIKHVDEENILDYHIRKNILLHLKVNQIILKLTFAELKKEVNFTNETSKLINIEELKDIYPTLEKGLSFVVSDKQDFLSAVHILVPYIEEVIRRILVKSKKVDSVVKTEKQKFFRKIELGNLLQNSEVKSIIGEDFAYSLKVFLIDNDQENFRNLLVHGLIESEKVNEANALFIAYTLLRLIKTLNYVGA